jgi:hypothetical protein
MNLLSLYTVTRVIIYSSIYYFHKTDSIINYQVKKRNIPKMFKNFVFHSIETGKISSHFSDCIENFSKWAQFIGYPGNTWNDFRYLELSTIILWFCNKLSKRIKYHDLNLNKHDIHLLLLHYINCFSLVEEWKQTDNFDIEYKIKTGSNKYRICFAWCMNVSNESDLLEILQPEIERFKSKAKTLNESMTEPTEYYFISCFKTENQIRYSIKSFTLYFALIDATNRLSDFFSYFQITDEDLEVIEKMKPNFVKGRLEKKEKLVYDNKKYYEKNPLNETSKFQDCLQDCLKNYDGNTSINEKHIFLCSLAICNHYGDLEDLFKQNCLNLFKSETEIDNDCLMVCEAISQYKYNLLGYEHIIDTNITKIELKFKKHSDCLVFPSVWYFPAFGEIKGLIEYLKERKDFIQHFFKEDLKNIKTVSVTINNQNHFFDKDVFISLMNHHEDYLYDENKWVRCLGDYEPYPPYSNRCPTLNNKDFNEYQIYVAEFIRNHEYQFSGNFFRNLDDKDEFKYHVGQTGNLIRIFYGSIESFRTYSHEYSHPKDLIKVFKKKFDDDNFNEKVPNSHQYKELHFHLLFLIILSKSNQIEYWCAEKYCSRLHTFLGQSNTSSTGYCDVFYIDKNNNSYIIELKLFKDFYLSENYKKNYSNSKDYKNFDDFVNFAIDQVRSYQLDDYEGIKSNNIKRHTIVFRIYEDFCMDCYLNYDNNEHGYQAYQRSSKTKLIGQKPFNDINEAIAFIESYEPQNQVETNEPYHSIIVNNTAIVLKRDLCVNKDLWLSRKYILSLIEKLRIYFK